MPPKPAPKAKTPVYKPETLRKEQLKKNKPKTKNSMGYKGATRV